MLTLRPTAAVLLCTLPPAARQAGHRSAVSSRAECIVGRQAIPPYTAPPRALVDRVSPGTRCRCLSSRCCSSSARSRFLCLAYIFFLLFLSLLPSLLGATCLSPLQLAVSFFRRVALLLLGLCWEFADHAVLSLSVVCTGRHRSRFFVLPLAPPSSSRRFLDTASSRRDGFMPLVVPFCDSLTVSVDNASGRDRDAA